MRNPIIATIYLLLILFINAPCWAEPNGGQTTTSSHNIINLDYKKGDSIFIWAPNGLYLYSKPCTAEVIECNPKMHLQKGSKVIFNFVSKSNTARYYGIESSFINISTRETEGYIFGGLTSKLKGPPLECNNLFEYANFAYGKPIKTLPPESSCASEFGEECAETIRTDFKDGVVYKHSLVIGYYGDSTTEDINIPQLPFSPHVAFLLGLNCGPKQLKYLFSYSDLNQDAAGYNFKLANYCEYNPEEKNQLSSNIFSLRLIQTDRFIPGKYWIRFEYVKRIGDSCR